MRIIFLCLILALQTGCLRYAYDAINKSSQEEIERQNQAKTDAEKKQKEIQHQKDLAVWQAQENENQARIKAQEAEIEKKAAAMGYKAMSIDEIKIDMNTLPLGAKVMTNGWYVKQGNIEFFSNLPSVESATTYFPLITDKASRGARSIIYSSSSSCSHGLCTLQILAQLTKCRISYFGRLSEERICLSVDHIVQ